MGKATRAEFIIAWFTIKKKKFWKVLRRLPTLHSHFRAREMVLKDA
jgi:hypothetical protein